MKHLLLALVLMANICFAAPVMKLLTKAQTMIDTHGSMQVSNQAGNLENCPLGVRATVSVAGALPTEDHFAIGFQCGTVSAGGCLGGVPCDPSIMGVGPRLSNVSVSYQVVDNSGATQLRETLSFSEPAGRLPTVLLRVGFKSAAPATLDKTLSGQPIIHLDEANYDGGKIILTMAGSVNRNRTPIGGQSICPTDGSGDSGQGIKLCQIHNNGQSFGCGGDSAGAFVYSAGANGLYTVTIPISIAEGTEVFCASGP